MKNYIIYLTFALSFLVSCSQKETEIVNVPVLRASCIYNDDSVYSYMELYKDQNRVIAQSYLAKADKIEKSDPKKAIYYIKRAITLFPEYDTYKRLGSLLMKQEFYGDARNAFELIVTKAQVYKNKEWESLYLFQSPENDIFYEYLAASVITNGISNYELHQAKEEGIDLNDLKEKLLKDERIKLDREGETFQNILLQFMSDEEVKNFQATETFYNKFVETIKDKTTSFDISEPSVQKFNYSRNDYEEDVEQNLSGLYIHFLKEKREKPDEWYDYNFNHFVKINDSIDAVFYAIDTSEYACPVEMRHIYHRVVTYSKGKIIDSKIIALQSGEDLMTMKFNTNSITCSEYKRAWKKPYNKKDFDNEILSNKLTGEKTYIIQEDGKISETNATVIPVIEPAADSTSS